MLGAMLHDPRSNRDLLRLVDDYPLAWVVSHAAPDFAATPLPLLAETDVEGKIVSLLGHYALRNPQVEMLKRASRALVLFSGPHGYISPQLVSKCGWAPTWNYAVAKVQVDIEFVPGENLSALQKLVEKMEGRQPGAWTVDRVGQRLDGMLGHIIAFRAHVRSIEGRFKLGQDETPETLSELLTRLDHAELKMWMSDFNVRPPPELARATAP